MADIKLKGYSGTEKEYAGVPKVLLHAPESTDEAPVLVPFTYGQAVSKNVAPKFTAGDMAVPIAEGELVTELTIVKPKNLLAENIAEGVDIAGIVGTLAGGEGGSGKIVIASGSFTTIGATTPVTVDHNLGVLPDMIITWFQQGSVGYINSVYGMSGALNERLGDSGGGRTCVLTNSGPVSSTVRFGIEDALNSSVELVGGIHSSTPKTFTIMGGTGWPMPTGYVMDWIALGGLVAHNDYIYISLVLDGMGNLIVKGGVSEIEQLEIYADGVLRGTVNYVYEDEFITDISAFVGNDKKYTITVTPVGATLSDKYAHIWAESVNGWVSPSAVYSPLVDIDIANNSLLNVGSGGSTYNAYYSGKKDGSLSSGVLTFTTGGGLTIPCDFMQTTGPWVVAFKVDSWSRNTSYRYNRFARGSGDVPSVYIDTQYGTQFKLAKNRVTKTTAAWYDTSVVSTVMNDNSLNFTMPSSAIVAFRNDGEYISLWINGSMYAKQSISYYTSFPSTFSLGDNVSTSNYYMESVKYSMFKAWNCALSDDAMRDIS